MATFDPSHVDDLVDTLAAAGLRATAKAAEANPPCVLVRVDGFEHDRLDGLTISTRLLLIVPDQDEHRALAALAALFNKVTTVLDPTGQTLARNVVLPHAPTHPLPALQVPFDLLT